MRSKTWHCAEGHYVRLSPFPTDAASCPICRGRLIEGPPSFTLELVPMLADDADRFSDRLMREKPVGR